MGREKQPQENKQTERLCTVVATPQTQAHPGYGERKVYRGATAVVRSSRETSLKQLVAPSLF